MKEASNTLSLSRRPWAPVEQGYPTSTWIIHILSLSLFHEWAADIKEREMAFAVLIWNLWLCERAQLMKTSQSSGFIRFNRWRHTRWRNIPVIFPSTQRHFHSELFCNSCLFLTLVFCLYIYTHEPWRQRIFCFEKHHVIKEHVNRQRGGTITIQQNVSCTSRHTRK